MPAPAGLAPRTLEQPARSAAVAASDRRARRPGAEVGEVVGRGEAADAEPATTARTPDQSACRPRESPSGIMPATHSA